MSRGRPPRPPPLAALLVLATLGAAGCSDALSSLDAVQRANRETFPCHLTPDFGRRGQELTVEVRLDPGLRARLAGAPAFPAEIHFGDGVALRSFQSGAEDRLEVDLLVSPLAEEGRRSPRLVFALGDKLLEAVGEFWILPALE